MAYLKKKLALDIDFGQYKTKLNGIHSHFLELHEWGKAR